VHFLPVMECPVVMSRSLSIPWSLVVGVCFWPLALARPCLCQEPQFGPELPKVELRIPETMADGRVIADLTDYLPHWQSFSADPESDSGPFVIEQSGLVRIASGARLDYEARSIYRLIVRASPIESERDPLFDSFAAILKSEGITEQAMAKLQSPERRIAVRISVEDEPETIRTELPQPEAETQKSHGDNAIVPPATVVTVDQTLPVPVPEASVASVSKPAPVPITTPIPLRSTHPVRLQPHTSQSRSPEDAAATPRNDAAAADGEQITRESSLRFRIAAIILVFGLGYLLKRLQRPDPDPAEEAAFEEKVVDEIEARIAASFAPARTGETEASVLRTPARDSHNGHDVDDEKECSTDGNYVLDEVGDFEIPAAPTISDPESLVGSEYYNVEEPFIISHDDAELRRTRQLQELQGCLDERNQRIVTLERQLQSLRGKLEQVTAHLALRVGGPIRDGLTASDLDNPLSSLAEESSCENDNCAASHVVSSEADCDPQADRWTSSSDSDPPNSVPEESSALDAGPPASAAGTPVRPELAELFGLQTRSVATAESRVMDATERTDEESHLDSVATYLDGLLQRSQNTSEFEGLISGHGKTKQTASRRGEKHSPQKRGSAPSYIESWLQDHPNPGEISEATSEESTSQSPPAQALAPRRPVDVEAARGHMKSLRQVAIQSAQQAVGESRLRTARNRMMRRTLLLVGLILIAILAIATDLFRRLSESPLGATIWAILILAAAELCLRIDSLRRNRHELLTRLQEEGFLRNTSRMHSQTGSATLISSTSRPDDLSGQFADPQTAKLNG